ncbi:hypothetical protein Nepgr_002807 [Nepenthes gracilis]|uniref:Uncharacterized protein n=1 Tax=Nepenthes gracilis TaxID=150966 RepID=A0AAD3P9A3_NEPGR|nr:hypothetical protein Nepgr_002807 [Nepenthes gracilis]
MGGNRSRRGWEYLGGDNGATREEHHGPEDRERGGISATSTTQQQQHIREGRYNATFTAWCFTVPSCSTASYKTSKTWLRSHHIRTSKTAMHHSGIGRILPNTKCYEDSDDVAAVLWLQLALRICYCYCVEGAAAG